MKKYKIPLLIILILVIFTLSIFILLMPKNVENAVLVERGANYSKAFVQGKVVTIKAGNISFEPLTVLNYKYNFFRAYDFQAVPPINERIMKKDRSTYDLEASGTASLSTEPFYYAVDKNNKITTADAGSVIVGKNNIKCFRDSDNKLKTFLIFPVDYSLMRVGLSTTGYSSFYHEKIQLKCNTPIKLFSVTENKQVEIPENSPVTITGDNNKILVNFNKTDWIFSSRTYLRGEKIIITNIKRGDPVFNPEYNGTLEFTTSDKGLIMINEVNLEEYLKKVVPSEMPVSGGIEALKCQAAAARTYALSDMLSDRFSSFGFYVDDSTQSQVYNNVPEKTLSSNAVDATRGLVLTFGGAPIDAKYYSTSGGTGAGYEDVWFKSDGTSEVKPYLQTDTYLLPAAVLPASEEEWLRFYKNTSLKALDSVSPYFRWRVDYSVKGLTACLNRSLKLIFEIRKDFISISQNGSLLKEFPVLEDITDIKITKRSTGGNVMEAVFTFKNAEVSLKNEYNVRSALRCSSEFTGEATKAVSYKGTALTNGSLLPSAFIAIEKKGAVFSVYGGGYGHGVGMSQYAAMELSKQGMEFKDILHIFYKNVQFDNIEE